MIMPAGSASATGLIPAVPAIARMTGNRAVAIAVVPTKTMMQVLDDEHHDDDDDQRRCAVKPKRMEN